MVAICKDCLKPLTDEELNYYEYRCEDCERDNHERIQAWRTGSIDPELDDIYGVEKRTVH